MDKKLFILAVLLACPAIMAKQSETNDKKEAVQEARDGLEQLQRFYNRLTQDYDSQDLQRYEARLNAALKKYYLTCLKNKSNISNTTGIVKETNNLLQHLCSISKTDDAYATASMIFMIHWSKLITNLSLQVDSLEENDNLQEATEEIKQLVEKMFVDPMNKRIDEIEDRIGSLDQIN